MKITKKDAVYLLIILCLFVGWFNAVMAQQNAVTHIKGLYNHLVEQCNSIIDVQDKNNFCIILPNGEKRCNQNDLNLLQSFG
jgi:hypothetical protein